jgi:SAM-dependent methyltransferase
MNEPAVYWKKVFGIESFKLKYLAQYWLYRLFSIKLGKLKDQKEYWAKRGQVYRAEITSSGYLDREIFFQNMIIEELKQREFNSFFEAGCGFGWNVLRVKREFPRAFVSGIDFSLSQLMNIDYFMPNVDLPVVNCDACSMALKDNAFDIGLTLGVFMNIHPEKIEKALSEMMRVCRKYIIHMEYDENHTTPQLRERRAFKTNIISHDYGSLYEKMGARIVKFKILGKHTGRMNFRF